jgi:D-alanine-D-alanine ligase
LGNDDSIASLPGEIIPCREFYDYVAKYIDDRSELIIPADLPLDLTRRIQELAIAAFLALDCAGMARVDFLLDRDTGQLYIGELNTIPGFTPISMYPKLWEASGISYSELIDRLIELALERHADHSRSETSYSPGDFEQ